MIRDIVRPGKFNTLLLSTDHVRMYARYLMQDFHVVIIDEAHSISNPSGQTFAAVSGMRGPKVLLTGTPSQTNGILC